MKKEITIFLMLFTLFGFSQENPKIDSLQTEIVNLNKKIEDLKSQIQTEILTNGYNLKAEKSYSFSVLKLKDKKYGEVLDTIKEGDIIKIIDKEIGFYKVEYNGTTGIVDESDLKVDYSSSLKLLEYKYVRNNSRKSSFSSSRKKSLDYSKPVKVKGHYRTTKSGKRVYVRPHTRKR
ncbi:SH3 domain-containing protein [Tenacibaculum aestuarii]|uniref:SH3 domain-containing protein n=1 Tax=Tenacibaculum aestuarii TaxID=362781 RepID=UPI003895AC0A